MPDDAQDRKLPASARKLQKARAEGQVARSRDLGHLAALGAGGAIVVAAAPLVSGWLGELLAAGLSFDAHALAQGSAMSDRLAGSVLRLLMVVLPFGAAIAAISVAATVLAGGWNFTLKPLEPRFDKLDPVAGLGRMFSKQHLADTLKVSLLALLLFTIGAAYLQARLAGFAALIAQPLPAALGAAARLVVGGLVFIGIALALFALVDVPLQRHLLLQRLRMTVEEAKKEHKDVEGNTEVKGKIRAKMRELANRRMLAKVPKADLVVMNPTHFAVALEYDEATMGAPRVVTKGADLLAFKIRDIASGARVPVLQAPPLARALYKHAEIDREIPAALFGAVAQVLAWVYQVRAAMAAGRPFNAAAPEVQLPPGLDPLSPPREAEP